MMRVKHRSRWTATTVFAGSVAVAAAGLACQSQEAVSERTGPSTVKNQAPALPIQASQKRAAPGVHSCCSAEAAEKTDAAQKHAATADAMFVQAWKPPEARKPLNLSYEVTRHDGVKVKLADLIGEPLVISFAYTRCINPNKCQRVTRTMAALRKKLAEADLLQKVRLLLITYDAEWDTLQNLRDYADLNGLELDDRSMFLKPPVDPEHKLYRDLGITASFNSAGVTMHNIQLLLIDRKGRLAREYRILIWDNDQVLQDLSRLIDEQT